MSIILHEPRDISPRILNARGGRLGLDQMDAEKLSKSVPPADMSSIRARTTRIFQIGFNKCGTESIYRFLQRSGISATRYNRGQLAAQIQDNIASGRKPLAGKFEDYVGFTGMQQISRQSVIEGNAFFREFYAYYPNSFFILNTRAKDDWIQARLSIGDGAFARRYAKALGFADTEAVVKHWSEAWDMHHHDVQAFFADKPGRLLIFDVEKNDPQDMVVFLEPAFQTRAADFRHEGTAPA